MIPLNDLGPGQCILSDSHAELLFILSFPHVMIFLSSEAYSTLDQRERRHTLDETTDTLPVLEVTLL